MYESIMPFYRGVDLQVGVLVQYQQPHRKFHTLEHLHYMFERMNEFMAQNRWFEDLKIDRDLMAYGIIFHDWVYTPGAKDNEERSADHAMLWMKAHELGWNGPIEDMIMSTKEHLPVPMTGIVNTHSGLLMDLDLSHLGDPNWEGYTTRARQVAQEFVPICGVTAFHEGRKAWIKSMLELETLYSTRYFKALYDKQAKENLQKELNWLDKTSIDTFS
jgi:predicted metal-dependent HD superfamily phosphohydrolase